MTILPYLLASLTDTERVVVESFVLDLIGERHQWARHDGDAKWHLVEKYGEGSAQTACRGRWPLSDPYETEGRPSLCDRCDFCQLAYVERRIGEMPKLVPTASPSPSMPASNGTTKTARAGRGTSSAVRALGRETAGSSAPAKRSDSTSRASLNPARAATSPVDVGLRELRDAAVAAPRRIEFDMADYSEGG